LRALFLTRHLAGCRVQHVLLLAPNVGASDVN
jgi:hypothetical protein